MYNRLTQILLGGFKTAQKPKLLAFSFKLLAISLLIGLQLITGMGSVYAGFGINNTAMLGYSDAKGRECLTVTDTAGLWIIKGPSISITKDVRNGRSGETSVSIVSALHGDTVEFIMRIINTGDYYAKDAVIVDSIPFGTVYETGSAMETQSLDPVNPPDTVSFQHVPGGEFDQYDTTTITAIKWIWNRIESTEQGSGKRTVKFRVRVQ